MNILVTGGCGFIGSNFIRQRLAAPGAAVRRMVNLDRLTYAGNPANVADCAKDSRYEFVRGDIADEALVGRLLARHAIAAIINFAAETHVDRSLDSPEPFGQTNVIGTLRLLNAARHYWAGLNAEKKNTFRFLQISTDEVYGTLMPNDPPFTEQTPFAPNSPYAASKAAGDHLVRAYGKSYGLPVLTINCSNNYGPFQFPEKLIPLTTLNALEGKPLPIYGDGEQVRDWLFVEDHATAINSVLVKGRVGEVYNVGGGNEPTNLEIVQRICALMEAKAPRPDGRSYAKQITFVADRPGHDRRYATDFSKLRSELGWTPVISLESGLAKTVDWYLTHRSWCDEITTQKYARQRLGTPV